MIEFLVNYVNALPDWIKVSVFLLLVVNGVVDCIGYMLSAATWLLERYNK